MATTRVDGTFRLVYLVFNAIGLLTTQEQQVACLPTLPLTSSPVAIS